MPSYGMFVVAAIIIASASIHYILHEEHILHEIDNKYVIYRSENILCLLQDYAYYGSENNSSFMEALNTSAEMK